MGKALASVFGGAPKQPVQQGPSESALKAQADQQKRIEEKEAKEARTAKANRAVIAARSGRGQGITLNPVTGERGVVSGGKLGGGA